jgi:hypothetical protein
MEEKNDLSLLSALFGDASPIEKIDLRLFSIGGSGAAALTTDEGATGSDEIPEAVLPGAGEDEVAPKKLDDEKNADTEEDGLLLDLVNSSSCRSALICFCWASASSSLNCLTI